MENLWDAEIVVIIEEYIPTVFDCFRLSTDTPGRHRRIRDKKLAVAIWAEPVPTLRYNADSFSLL
jgi:hypothetical protein